MEEPSEIYSRPELAAIPYTDDVDDVDDDLESLLCPGVVVETFDDMFFELTRRRRAWWASKRMRTWLLVKGYTLYCRIRDDAGLPTSEAYPPNVDIKESFFPYADHGGPDCESPPRFAVITDARGLVNFVHDHQGRHFALKAIVDGSEELRILRYLQMQGTPSVEAFQNVIPVLDILACEGHWLAIMPRFICFPLSLIDLNHLPN
ncbi:hypothetical protein H0H92_004940 [Tricholoma furcatifolium]|nr:hypothetical protein H0H92_004940 [Tricholoma furcatifolium]